MSSGGSRPSLLCPLQSREAALALQQPRWEVFFSFDIAANEETGALWSLGMHHSQQGLAGGRGCEGSAADRDMTHGAAQSIPGVSAWSVIPCQQCFSLLKFLAELAQGCCR